MPLFLIERNLAEQLDLSEVDVEEITRVNDENEITWLFSFLSADKKKTFCIYEAVSAEAIMEAARRLEIPADVITQVSELTPEMYGLAGAAVRKPVM